MVQKLRRKYSLPLLLEIAQLPRATFYYHVKRMQKADKYAEAKAEISTIYHKNKGRYGYRRITAALHNNGIHLNHKTVQRLMKELGLVCRVRVKKYRSYKGEVGRIAPNLLNRNFHAERPNQKWVTGWRKHFYRHPGRKCRRRRAGRDDGTWVGDHPDERLCRL